MPGRGVALTNDFDKICQVCLGFIKQLFQVWCMYCTYVIATANIRDMTQARRKLSTQILHHVQSNQWRKVKLHIFLGCGVALKGVV
jgi:hypothetical protein